MTILDSIILGAVQGLTEFIPVSSSGHLVIAHHFLGLESSPAFDSLINLGTFLALVVYFRARLWGIVVRLVKYHDWQLIRNIAISAAPVCAIGLLCKDFFESSLVQSTWVVAGMLVVLGVVMIVIERLPRASNIDSPEQLSTKRAVIIGLAQVLALVPGTSRSGSTLIAGRLAGLSYKQAAEYSFLLSIPVMFAVVLLGFVGSDGREYIAANATVWVVSNLTAFVLGLVAVRFMLRFLAKGGLKGFGIYRIILAAVVVTTLLITG